MQTMKENFKAVSESDAGLPSGLVKLEEFIFDLHTFSIMIYRGLGSCTENSKGSENQFLLTYLRYRCEAGWVTFH